MKTYWIVVCESGLIVREDEWGSGFYSSLPSAEYEAEKQAKENPGKSFTVYKVESRFVIDGLSVERPK